MFGITEQKIQKWKEKNKADKIVKAMQHKDKAIRLSAIKAGAEMKDDKVYNALVLFLKDADPEIRAGSAEALGEMGRISAQGHLRLISETDSDENVRNIAREAMKNIINSKEKLGS